MWDASSLLSAQPHGLVVSVLSKYKRFFVYSSVSVSSLIWKTFLLLFQKLSRDVTVSIAKCCSCNVSSKEKFWPSSFFLYIQMIVFANIWCFLATFGANTPQSYTALILELTIFWEPKGSVISDFSY